MYKPLSLYIGLRYTRAKRRNYFISFISAASMIGIALGIAALITVLSVMNGFDREIKKRVFSIIPPITVTSIAGPILDWSTIDSTLQEVPGVTGVAPYVQGEALINANNSTKPAVLNGIEPEAEKKITDIAKKMVEGTLDSLKPGTFKIVLGQELAFLLNAHVGDKITVMTPKVTLTPAGVLPRFKRFTVSGVFNTGGGFGFNRSVAFINISDAKKLLGMTQGVSGIHVNVSNPFIAGKTAMALQDKLSATADISTWADQFGEFFRAVQLEKTMMFFILLLIIAVAAFNLVSTLIMVVSEKEADIAILRTMGATPQTILGIFLVQGCFIGFIGTFIGLILGVVIAWNVTALVNFIQNVFHVQFLSSNIYFVNYLPSHIEWGDVTKICITSLALCLLATIYPAYKASKLEPVESLRYE